MDEQVIQMPTMPITLFSPTSLTTYLPSAHSIQELPFSTASTSLATAVCTSLVDNLHPLNVQPCLQSIMQDSQTTGTTCQHKILYLSIKYLSYHKLHRHQTSLYLLQWLTEAQYLFEGGRQVHDLQMLAENGELENLLGELKVMKETHPAMNKQTDGVRMVDRVDFLMKVLYQKILANDSWFKQVSDGGTQSPTGYWRAFQQNKQNLTNQSSILFNSTDQLCRVLSTCTSIILGNHQLIRSISQHSFYLYAKLHLLYIKQQTIQTLYKQYVQGKKQPTDRIEEFIVKLLNYNNWHQCYQLCLSLVPGYFAHLLCALVFQYVPMCRKMLLQQDSEYGWRAMLGMLEEGCRVSCEVFIGTIKLYEELHEHKPTYFQEVENLLYRYLPYQTITTYEQLQKIKQMVKMSMKYNISEYYFRTYMSNILRMHMEQPITKFTIELMMVELSMYFPEELDHFEFVYLEEGYLMQSNLQAPFDYTILDKIKEVSGANGEIKNKHIKRKLASYFQSFFVLRSMMEMDTEEQISSLLEMMKEKHCEAKGEILRMGRKIIHHFCMLEQDERQCLREHVLHLKDALKLYIVDMEEKHISCREITQLKEILY